MTSAEYTCGHPEIWHSKDGDRCEFHNGNPERCKCTGYTPTGTIHQQTGSSHGVRAALCGAEGKDLVVSGWQSDVNCRECLTLAKQGHQP